MNCKALPIGQRWGGLQTIAMHPSQIRRLLSLLGMSKFKSPVSLLRQHYQCPKCQGSGHVFFLIIDYFVINLSSKKCLSQTFLLLTKTSYLWQNRAFHHYRKGCDQNAPLKKHPDLDRLLREEYRSLQDFNRAKGKTNNSAVKEDAH